MEIVHSNRAKTDISNEGDTFTIIQKFKGCRCKTIGQGNITIKKHLERKKNCGEECLRFKLLGKSPLGD